MFKGLKNKIREETGNDVSQISLPVRNVGQSVKGRHSRQGSSSSLGSFSLDGHHDDSSSPPASAIIPESPANSIEKVQIWWTYYFLFKPIQKNGFFKSFKPYHPIGKTLTFKFKIWIHFRCREGGL